MNNIKEEFVRKRLLPHYIECLKNYSNISFMESDLTDLKTSKVLYDKCACLWTNGNLIERHLQSVAPEEIERIVSSCFGPNEELLLHLNGADYCGFLRIPNYSAINYAFNKK